MTLSLSIDVVSDVICPWCFLGARRLATAIAACPEVTVDVRWRPFFLDPSLPREGMDRATYMARKFTPERLAAAHERLVEAGREENIDYAFDRIARVPNTMDAHRVIRWAASAGDGVQGRVASALFSSYFEAARDIGDRDVLTGIAAECGMQSGIVRALLDSESDIDAVREEVATSTGMGITGVPCFLLAGRYAVLGAQPLETMVEAIRSVAALLESERASGQTA